MITSINEFFKKNNKEYNKHEYKIEIKNVLFDVLYVNCEIKCIPNINIKAGQAKQTLIAEVLDYLNEHIAEIFSWNAESNDFIYDINMKYLLNKLK